MTDGGSASADFPQPPEVPPEQIGTGSTTLRFEDVAQDGRLRLEGVWPPIGPVLWGRMRFAESLAHLGKQGIRAVLTRVIMEGGAEPLSVRNRSEHEVRYRLAHTVDERGAPTRLVFDTWLTSHAPRGIENAPGLPSDGPRVLAARAYGQHIFTKPAAPPGRHRVLELDAPGVPRVPPERTQWLDPAALLALPADATPLEPAPRPDGQPLVFGLAHTDGNQHVNFLAYPRMAEEAALRRLAALGRSARLLARRADVGYRKPCFAGDVMRLVLQAYARGERVGVVAAFVPDTPDLAHGRTVAFSDLPRPHCATRIELLP